ncbi:hypothetical protein K474DRAFT_1669017 [Panus rudis PR-1116 ss-1]|nr:hypothetical protein K474DRAFT_1669017 [Panus rudis PR-1116 ss-1]
MGATGSGKTTFINLLSGSKLRVGYGLHSCTAEVEAAQPFIVDGRSVTLIDTPGFDDTNKTEAEILALISQFLATTYTNGRKLNGVVYLHRISDYRMGGIARRNFRLFRQLCGDDSLQNVIIVTNMWGDVKPEVGEAREAELARSDSFFRAALDKGAQLMRHENTKRSAYRILGAVMGFTPRALRIQEELVDEELLLAETDVGAGLQAELRRQSLAQQEIVRELSVEVKELEENQDCCPSVLDELRADLQKAQEALARAEIENKKLVEFHGRTQLELEKKMEALMDAMERREIELHESREHELQQQQLIEELENALAIGDEYDSDNEADTPKSRAQLVKPLERRESRQELEAALTTAREERDRLQSTLADERYRNDVNMKVLYKAHQLDVELLEAQYERKVADMEQQHEVKAQQALQAQRALRNQGGRVRVNSGYGKVQLMLLPVKGSPRFTPGFFQDLGTAVRAL